MIGILAEVATFGETLGHTTISAVFGILGVVLLFLGHKFFHAIELGKKLSGIDFQEEIKKGNVAAAIYEAAVEAAFLLALGYIIGQVVA